MIFSKQVKEELNSLPIKGNCCKKAYLVGALMSAEQTDGGVTVSISSEETAEKVIFLLKTLYKCIPDSKKTKRGCFETTRLLFRQRKIEELLAFSSRYSSGQETNELFTCQNCRSAFLRGVFCSCGSVSDPKKTFSLELRVKEENRAKLILDVIDTWEITLPSITKRGDRMGLFYRRESAIEDFLAACGSNICIFAFYDAVVEKDLRNAENRATNCVAHNISKSVSASSNHISAIKALISSKTMNELPEELRQTAELRIANPDITLSELADLHKPKISKSGLDHRLVRLAEEARRRKLI